MGSQREERFTSNRSLNDSHDEQTKFKVKPKVYNFVFPDRKNKVFSPYAGGKYFVKTVGGITNQISKRILMKMNAPIAQNIAPKDSLESRVGSFSAEKVNIFRGIFQS